MEQIRTRLQQSVLAILEQVDAVGETEAGIHLNAALIALGHEGSMLADEADRPG